jgi:predicted transcriptional regulator YdeE
MTVEIKHLEAITLAALSADAPDASREQTGGLVQTLFEQVIDRMETAAADRTTPIARYKPHPLTHTTRTDTGDPTVQVIAGYALAGNQVPGLHNHVLPAAEVAAVVHRGPMSTISTAYQELARWAESTGRAPKTFSWREYYLEAADDDQSDWIVEVQLEL